MNTLTLLLNIVIPAICVYVVHLVMNQMKVQQLEFTKTIIALTEKSSEYNAVTRPHEAPVKKPKTKQEVKPKFSLEGMLT